MDLANGRFIEGKCAVEGIDLDAIQEEILVVAIDGEIEKDVLGAALDPDNAIISLLLDRLLLGRWEGACRTVDLDGLRFGVEGNSRSTRTRVGDFANTRRKKNGVRA